MRKCPNGHEVSDEVKFCPTCGAKVEDNGTRFCAKCGTEFKKEDNFCPKCGAPVNKVLADEKEKPTKRSKKKIIIPVVIFLIMLVAAGGWYWWNVVRYDNILKTLSVAISKYDEVYTFRDGLAMVCKGDKHGFIDEQGNEVVPCIYENLNSRYDQGFHDGLAIVKCDDDCYGFIDKKGSLVFRNEKAVFCNIFSEGLVLVCKDEKYGYKDTKGNLVIPYQYDNAGDFSEGLAAVAQNGKYGYIDKKGNFIIPLDRDVKEGFGDYNLAPYFQNGFGNIVNDNGKYGAIDQSGKIVIKCQYDDVFSFEEGLAAVCKNGKHGYIDKTGNETISLQYDFASSFSDGLALVQKGGKKYFIDKTGKVVLSPDYDYVGTFQDGLAVAKKGGMYGYIDKNGEEVIPLRYTEAGDFCDGLAYVRKGDMNGFVDKRGKSTFDFETDETKKIIEEKKRIEEDKRKQEEAAEAERVEAERRKGVEREVNLSYTKEDENNKASCYGNYGAGYGGDPGTYKRVTSDWIVIPEGKVWIYDHHKTNCPKIYVAHQSREAGGSSARKVYYLLDGGLPIFRAGDKIFIGFNVWGGGPRTWTTSVYFKEKDEDLFY